MMVAGEELDVRSQEVHAHVLRSQALRDNLAVYGKHGFRYGDLNNE